MPDIGQPERAMQNRIVALFRWFCDDTFQEVSSFVAGDAVMLRGEIEDFQRTSRRLQVLYVLVMGGEAHDPDVSVSPQ